MFNFLKAAQDKLNAITMNNNVYVSGGKLKASVTSVENGLKKNTSIQQLITDSNLEYIITTRGKNPQVVDITIDEYIEQKRRYEIRIQLSSIQSVINLAEMVRRKYPEYIETPLEENTVELDDPDLEEKAPIPDPVVEQANLEEKAPIPVPQANLLYYGADICLIIELEDHEKFVDNEKIFDIEIRGERSPTKILFKVEDIARLFEMTRLGNQMTTQEFYQEGVHYVILSTKPDSSESSEIYFKCNSLKPDSSESSEKRLNLFSPKPDSSASTHGKNRRAFLTWFGLFKVLFASRSGNEYRHKMATWVMNTMFVHQFGSTTERKLLADTLTMYKTCLNGTSGVYLVRIGKVKDLRISMKIFKDDYPSDFDNAFIYKYGRANDVLRRFSEHCATKHYGAYSDTIELSWFVILPSEKEKKAEGVLAGYFADRNLKFDFTDNSGKCHTELAIIKHDELQGVREEYLKLIHKYPNAENAISLFIDNIRSQYNAKIAELTHKAELLSIQHELTIKENELALKDQQYQNGLVIREKDDLIKDGRHKNEILQMQLEFANFRLQTK